MKGVVDALARIINALLALVNRLKAQRYRDDPAAAIAGDDRRVRKSDQSYSDLASSGRDRTE